MFKCIKQRETLVLWRVELKFRLPVFTNNCILCRAMYYLVEFHFYWVRLLPGGSQVNKDISSPLFPPSSTHRCNSTSFVCSSFCDILLIFSLQHNFLLLRLYTICLDTSTFLPVHLNTLRLICFIWMFFCRSLWPFVDGLCLWGLMAVLSLLHIFAVFFSSFFLSHSPEEVIHIRLFSTWWVLQHIQHTARHRNIFVWKAEIMSLHQA